MAYKCNKLHIAAAQFRQKWSRQARTEQEEKLRLEGKESEIAVPALDTSGQTTGEMGLGYRSLLGLGPQNLPSSNYEHRHWRDCNTRIPQYSNKYSHCSYPNTAHSNLAIVGRRRD